MTMLRNSLLVVPVVLAMAVARSESRVMEGSVPSRTTCLGGDASGDFSKVAPTAKPGSPSFSLFDPSFGALNSVTIRCEGSGVFSGSLRNGASSADSYTASTRVVFTLSSGNDAIDGLLSRAGGFEFVGSASHRGEVEPGREGRFGPVEYEAGRSVTFTAPDDLACFLGVAPLELRVSTRTEAGVSPSNPAGATASSATTAAVAVTITYDYSSDHDQVREHVPAVPEQFAVAALGD